MVDAEASRLVLAKASYRSITDPDKFVNIYTLLNSTDSRNELAAYITNYQNSTTANSTDGMSVIAFNALLQEVQNQWQAGARQTMIGSVFTNTTNYFTAAQARQLILMVDAEANRLLLAKSSYRSIVDPVNFITVSDLLSSQLSKNELSAYVTSYNNTAAHAAMNATTFATLLKNVQNQWQAAAKLSMIMDAFNGSNYFTAAQARQLIQTVDAEASRLQLAKAAYKTTTDQQNYSSVADLLDLQTSRNELAAYIRNGADVVINSGNVRTAMADAAFQDIITHIVDQWIPGSKMQALQDVFANTANYFSTAQVKQLVAYVSIEANRLQLLKSAYRSVTDKTNFSNTYELLATQPGRDALAVYVQAYTDR